jgi:dihydroflavonol-4-reductase
MILVTGGTGLLGSHLLYELVKSGKKVRALKRESSDLQKTRKTFAYYSKDSESLFAGIEWINAGLDDIYSLREAMEDVDEVYHCAAMVSFNPKDYNALMKTNVEGTANIINAAIEKKISKFCHVSSVSALGKSTREEINEETPWKPGKDVSGYSLSKYGAEREAWRGMEEGLNMVIVNPSIIIGPGNWTSGSSNMFTGGYKGMRFYTEGTGGFVDVRDVVKSMIRLMKQEKYSQGYIISAENLGFREFFDLIHDQLGRPRSSYKAGKLISSLAWRASMLASFITRKEPLLTKETARAAQQKYRLSNNKIKAELGFEFLPLRDSISQTCALFLKDRHK